MAHITPRMFFGLLAFSFLAGTTTTLTIVRAVLLSYGCK